MSTTRSSMNRTDSSLRSPSISSKVRSLSSTSSSDPALVKVTEA